MISSRDKINYLVILLCVIIIILSVSFKKNIDEEQFYGILIIVAILILATIYILVGNKQEHFTQDKTRNCYNINKESQGYQNKIYDRLEGLMEIEEKDRKNIEYDNEMEKIIEMGHYNLDYIANGETF
tara:strand:- start:582 stop:965 length:384 start_codon:yes stop_codon:yes gene_type:complete